MKLILSLSLVILFHGVAVHAQKTRTRQTQQETAGRMRIIADPDVRISFDGNIPHMEAYIGASSSNPDLLFACSQLIVPGRELYATEARLYQSESAGARWNTILLPDEINGGWDNAVAAGKNGNLYYLTSNLQNGLTLYYSTDNGKRWEHTFIKNTNSWDRPYIAVDNSTSIYKDHVYVVGETDEGVTIIRSSDGGRTFSQPVVACPALTNENVAVTAAPMILSNGAIVIACAPYPNFPARASWKDAKIGLVSSTDGGQTFKAFFPSFTIQRQIPKDYYAARERGDVLMTGNFMAGPSFAVAPLGSPFANRLFASWQNIESTGNSQLLFSWSDDGSKWSIPMPVSPYQPTVRSAGLRQGAPMLAINKNGIIGIAWYDGRLSENNKSYSIYFTASGDGGNTFLPSVKISSAESFPAGTEQNTLPAFLAGKASANGERTVTMTSPFSTRSTGGDYSSMAVDEAGRFHPLWLDARNSMAWQLYTATIRVQSEKAIRRITEDDTSAVIPDTGSSKCLLNNEIQLIFGEPKWNVAGNEIEVPVQLLNASSDTIFTPVTVHVTNAMLTSSRAKVYATNVRVPEFFDPSRATFTNSANFLYRISPGSPLFPNGVTAPINWRLRITVAQWVDFIFNLTITGGRCQSKNK